MDVLKLNNLISIKQGIDEEFDFQITHINSFDLVNLYEVIRLSEDEENGVQRFENKSRVDSIAEFCQQKNAIFPTPIIVSLNTDFILSESPSELNIRIHSSDLGKPFSVIDGQHRLAGLTKFHRDHTSKSFDLPLIIYRDADQRTSASIFVTINSNQKPVDRSTISQLFGIIYSNNTNLYTVESFSSFIVNLLNKNKNSPFHNQIKILGKKINGTEFISQGTISKKIIENITTKPQRDNLSIERGQPLSKDQKRPFREFFASNEPIYVAKILIEYFNAFIYVFKNIWHDDAYLARKSVGFSALMRLLRYLLIEEIAVDYNGFVYIFEKIQSDPILQVDELFLANRGSSESVAGEISNSLIEIASRH